MTARTCALAAVMIGGAAAGAAAQPAAPTAAQVLGNVQRFYGRASHLTATFEQTVTNATFQRTKTSAGTLWVARPSQFRFDYQRKRGGRSILARSFVFDGTTLWVIDPPNLQILKYRTPGGPLPAAVSFLTGSHQLAAQFRVAFDRSGRYGGAGAIVLALTPNRPSAQSQRLFFVVDPARWEVRESIVIDSAGNTNQFRFRNANLAAPIKPSWFRVNPARLPTYKLVVVGGGAPPAPAPARGAGAAAKSTP